MKINVLSSVYQYFDATKLPTPIAQFTSSASRFLTTRPSMPKSFSLYAVAVLGGVSVIMLFFLRYMRNSPVKSALIEQIISSLENLEDFNKYWKELPMIERNHIGAYGEEFYPSILPEQMTHHTMRGKVDGFGRKLMAFKMKITVPPTHQKDVYESMTKDKDGNVIDRGVFILFQRWAAIPEHVTVSFSGRPLPISMPFNCGESLFSISSRTANKEMQRCFLELIQRGSFTQNGCIFALDKEAVGVRN